MIFQPLQNGIEVMKHPAEYLLFGFDPPIAPFAWDTGDLTEPALSGPHRTYLKHSPPYSASMAQSTRLLLTGSTSTGILVMVKPTERVVMELVSDLVKYTLPPSSIILRNTSGELRGPGRIQKRFYMDGLRHIIAPGGSGGSVTDFEASGFKTFSLTALQKSWLQNRFFLNANGEVRFRFAFIPCGTSRAIVSARPSLATTNSLPVNTIAFTFAAPAPADCKLIAEYSGPDGWKPLSFTDSTDGFLRNGYLHFEPPADWASTSRWSPTMDIGGAGPGTGPRARWIRLQRRSAKGTGATLASTQPQNLPYLICSRVENPLALPLSAKHVGQEVTFRFVPMNSEGEEDLSAASLFTGAIEGKAFA